MPATSTNTGRNYSAVSIVAPINALPPEVLSHIFGLLLDEQIRIDRKAIYKDTAELPKYPDILSLVCSRWRKVAISTQTLWSHINFFPHQIVNKSLLSRAKTCAVRSGRSPLQIHILSERSSAATQLGDKENLCQFLASNAARISSLELDIHYSWTSFPRAMLQSCLVKGAPGVLTRLVLSGSCGDRPPFGFINIEATANPHHANSVLLDIPERLLEAVLSPITVLQLNNIFLYWTSRAYHGLVELRLRGRGTSTPSITEAQLVGILASSPKLRILDFSIKITEFSPNNTSVVLVQLEELEELGLGHMMLNQLGTVLRLLAPGSRMLQISIQVPYESRVPTSTEFDGDVKGFFTRAHVSKLYVYDPDTLSRISEIYRLAPRLQVLVLDEFDVRSAIEPASFPDNDDCSASNHHVDQVYLLRSDIHLSRLQWILRRYPTRRLTLWDSDVHRNDQRLNKQELREVLVQDCPVVNILLRKRHPNPPVHWQ